MERDRITVGRVPDVGDRDALRDVFEASYHRLVVQLYVVTGDLDEAEQLVREAFVRAAAAGRRLRRVDDPEAWLRSTAVRAHGTRWRRSSSRLGSRGRAPSSGIVPPDFDDLVCRGVRRRVRRRTGLAAAAYGLALVAGASVLLDDAPAPPPSPVSTPVPLRAGLPEVEELGDRIPPGRAGMPSVLPGPAAAAVTVRIPERGVWRENASGSGIYSPIRRGTAWLHLATYVVDGVVQQPCRSSYVSALSWTGAGFLPAGSGLAALADTITGIPRADAVVPPHTVARWGTTAVHVRVRVPDAGCRNGNLPWTFDTRRGGEFLGNPDARLDFWVVELGGLTVVVEAERPLRATADERRALTRLLASIELLDGESR